MGYNLERREDTWPLLQRSSKKIFVWLYVCNRSLLTSSIVWSGQCCHKSEFKKFYEPNYSGRVVWCQKPRNYPTLTPFYCDNHFDCFFVFSDRYVVTSQESTIVRFADEIYACWKPIKSLELLWRYCSSQLPAAPTRIL